MAKPPETQQEQEAQWDAQRAERYTQFEAGWQVRQRKTRRTWAIRGAIALLVAVIVAVMLL